jgi:hypothetical protein
MNARIASRRTDLLIAIAVIAAVLLVVAATVLGGAVGAASARDAAVSAAGVLGRDAAASDRLPAAFPAEAHGTGGIDPASARSLGTQGGTAYWIPLDRAANVCLLAQSTRDRAVTSGSCVSPAELERSGAALRVDGAKWALEAFLVPDSVDAAAASGAWQAVGDNLVVYSAASVGVAARAGSSLDLPRDGGPVLTLTRLADPVS